MNATPRVLSDLCVPHVELRDPREHPTLLFRYIDISSVNSRTKRIESCKAVRGSDASVRARQVVQSGDVLVSTVRPNLNNVALVGDELDGAICSTGFCVLRSGPELSPGYLFAFVQSRLFVDALVGIVQGALYPAVTDRQVFAQRIPWIEVSRQKQIADKLKGLFNEFDRAKTGLQKQLEELELLPQKLLAQVFQR